MTTFERIRELAKKRGLTLKQVAVKAGLSENAIYRYNQGIEPKLPTLKAIADVLHVSPDYLTGDSDDYSEITHKKPVVDINKDEAILTFDGKPIPEEDMEIIRRLFRGK